MWSHTHCLWLPYVQPSPDLHWLPQLIGDGMGNGRLPGTRPATQQAHHALGPGHIGPAPKAPLGGDELMSFPSIEQETELPVGGIIQDKVTKSKGRDNTTIKVYHL